MRETEIRESSQPDFNKWGRRDPPDKERAQPFLCFHRVKLPEN
jgi:hypothetical protein